jgi:hypothetical protein
MTDEKLIFCSAATTGVYIRLMCLMHKSGEYGKILLKQKFEKTSSNLKNLASQLAVQLPYDYQTILFALEELVATKVLQEEPCAISQRRMVRDNEISEKRALAGKKGGDNSLGKRKNDYPETHTQDENFALNFAQAKPQANSENEYEDKNENNIPDNRKGGVGENQNPGDTPAPPEPPAPPKEKTWRDSFEIYQKEVRDAFTQAVENKKWLAERQRYHPGLNIPLTLEKACRDYWVKEAGWKKKKASKTVKNDWKATFNNALTVDCNKVWKTKEQLEKEKNEQKQDIHI